MPKHGIDQVKVRHEQESRTHRQISGIFQSDVTIRTLLESLAEGVIIIDNSGTILLVNTRSEQMFGYPKGDLIGKSHAVLIPERFRNIHEEHEALFFAEPTTKPMGQLLDLAGLRRDGSEFPLEISLSFLETINGILVMAFLSNITLRKQYESHLRKTEELFHIQVEGVKDYAIFMLDAQGKVLNWNAGAERLKGYRDEEIIGTHFSCFYTEEDKNAGKPEEELKKAAVEGRVAYEGWRIGKDGSRFWADVIITALRDDNGNLRGFSKVTHDITERKREKDALLENELKLKKAQEIAKMGSWTYDFQDRISWSDELYRIYGVSPETFTPTVESFINLIHPDDQPAMQGWITACAANEKPGELEFRIIWPDSSVHFMSGRGELIFEAAGRPGYMAGTAMDITERKLAEEKIAQLNYDLTARSAQLEAANINLEAFNYTVAHDLRQPLNIIFMACQAIKELYSDQLQDECLEYIQDVYDGVIRMNRLIDDLIKFSRLSHFELHREEVNMCALAHEVVTMLKQNEPERQVDFKMTDGIVAYADASLMRVVLHNLLGNAWKYTGMQKEAVIEFGTTEIDGKLVYLVRDNGAGFDKADAANLFIPFQRLPGVEEFKGSGIGLATVERIIQRHGGKIWTEGEPGKGATFYFTLSADNDSD